MSPAQVEPLVEAAGLRHVYREGDSTREVLHGVDLKIWPGTNVFLTGYSGSGKTTLLSLIGCLRSVQQGSLKLFGDELRGATVSRLLKMRRRIGYVFQGFNLLDFMSIRRNVLQTLELQSDFSPREARRRCDEMLDKVGLGPRIHHYPNDLSGGQKQRVAIARALVHRPKLVLADEPTAALDAKTGREIIELFQRLAREQGTAVLVVTHNMRLLDAADEIVRMDDGRLGTAVTEQISLAFPTLSESQLIEVAAHARQRTYRPGETIIRQGDEANEFFILLEGEAGVLCEVPGVGSDHLFRFNRRGDYFGEIGLLQDHGRRMATVVAGGLTDTQVLVIERAAFVAMIDESRLTRAVIRDEMLERLERLASVRGSVV